MIVFGLGSGRCGTKSLQILLNQDPKTACFHEINPAAMAWSGAEAAVLSLLRDFEFKLSNPTAEHVGLQVDMTRNIDANTVEAIQRFTTKPLEHVADVALYYLPYVETLLSQTDQIRFPCLKRSKQETVRSFITKLSAPGSRNFLERKLLRRHASRNHFRPEKYGRWIHDRTWDKCFPSYDASLSLEEALETYWDEYYTKAEALQSSYPEHVRIFSIDCLNDLEGQNSLLEFCNLPLNDTYTPVHSNKSPK